MNRRWTREELLIVLNLYHKLLFGQMDARQKAVIDLAGRMGRSANSVAMKLVNLASLDPALKLRGIKGLPGTSKLDREMWDEYHSKPDELIPIAQEKFDSLFIADEGDSTEVIPGKGASESLHPLPAIRKSYGRRSKGAAKPTSGTSCSTITTTVAA